MRLQSAPAQYSITDQNLLREALGRADDENLKRVADIILPNNIRLVLTSPNGTKYALAVSNAGALSAVTYP